MKIIVHRGTKQIGGSCVEVQSGDDRILLDFGMPLALDEDGQIVAGQSVEALLASGVLPNVEGVYSGSNPQIRAVVMSHVHQDHMGLAQYVHPTVPVYATDGTWALYDALQPFIPRAGEITSREILPKQKPVCFGSLSVTAIPVDHSAPDAVALLVEGDRKRVLYSGDLRAHGRKSYLYDSLIRQMAGTLDVMLLEGTTIGRPDAAFATEESLETDLLALLAQQKHFALIFCSAQNLDRLVTIYRSVKRAHKLMVIDLYTAFTLNKLQCISTHLPQWHWPEVRVVPWGYQQRRLADAGYTSFVEETKKHWIGWGRMKAQKHNVAFLMRSNRKVADLERELGEEVRDVQVIWSMWDGYWVQDQYIRPLCEKYGIERVSLHTSGHASWQDLQILVEGLQPKTIIPIHTEHAEQFTHQFTNVNLLLDGETFTFQ